MQQKKSSLKDFQVVTKLGEGAFGQVFKVKRKLDAKQYAMKKIKIASMKPKQKQNALNEVRILASYNDEYIIGFKQAFYDQNSETLCVVMQFAAGGDIAKLNQTHLKQRTRYKEQQIWTALVHMTTGLKSLHQKKILHRDLKCANIFVTADKKFKLGDLNVSKVLKKDFASTQTGTPYYASPQVWKDQPYGVKSDMWSLGCVLYEMAALRPPFTANDLSGLYKKICLGIFDRIPLQYTNDLHTVISSLLKLDPKKRPDVDELLNNPLVRKYFKGEWDTEKQESVCDSLLKTIKYNPNDLKGLKNILPKANYMQDIKNQDSKSTKNIKQKTQIERDKPLDKNDRILKDFLEKKRQIQDRQRQSRCKLQKEEKEKIAVKHQRTFSACGIRNTNIYDSPRIVVHKQDQNPLPAPNSCKPTKKEENPLSNGRLPPKPQGQGMAYKLPPKPSYHLPPINASNKSTEISSQRELSKQNLRNLGSRIVGDSPTPKAQTPRQSVARSNSAQKVIYPCWWG